MKMTNLFVKNEALFVQSLNEYLWKKEQFNGPRNWYSVTIHIDLIQNRLNCL